MREQNEPPAAVGCLFSRDTSSSPGRWDSVLKGAGSSSRCAEKNIPGKRNSAHRLLSRQSVGRLKACERAERKAMEAELVDVCQDRA